MYGTNGSYGIKVKQVATPKGLDISRLITVVISNHKCFCPTQLSQGTESVAKARWDSNRQDNMNHSTEGNWDENLCIFLMAAFLTINLKEANIELWILAIYTYISSVMQIQQPVSCLKEFKEKWINTISPGE